MGWFNYFKLLEKYNGDLEAATKEELDFAAQSNPDNPTDARRIALEKYERTYGKGGGRNE